MKTMITLLMNHEFTRVEGSCCWLVIIPGTRWLSLNDGHPLGEPQSNAGYPRLTIAFPHETIATIMPPLSLWLTHLTHLVSCSPWNPGWHEGSPSFTSQGSGVDDEASTETTAVDTADSTEECLAQRIDAELHLQCVKVTDSSIHIMILCR